MPPEGHFPYSEASYGTCWVQALLAEPWSLPRLSVAFLGCQTHQHCATGCASAVAHSRTKGPLS